MIFFGSTAHLKLFILITHSVCGALQVGKCFTEPKISITVIINTIIYVLECSRLSHPRLVSISRAKIPGKI